jgi:hypothetical protein
MHNYSNSRHPFDICGVERLWQSSDSIDHGIFCQFPVNDVLQAFVIPPEGWIRTRVLADGKILDPMLPTLIISHKHVARMMMSFTS